MNDKGRYSKTICSQPIVQLLGFELLQRIAAIHAVMPGQVYLTGGTVRDLLMGGEPADIDLTVPRYARKWAARFAELTGGTYVLLGREEDAARVVWMGRDIDFSSFREGAENIRQELVKRDITINSMAVPLGSFLRPERVAVPEKLEVIDPAGGLMDLQRRSIRITSPHAFKSDPLRMLRVFRFAATLGFSIEKKTFDLATRQAEWIVRPAAERVGHELELIMSSSRAHAVVSDLARSGLLFNIVPELRQGVGMEQPASHHLDVFDHSLATLLSMMEVQQKPAHYFSKYAEILKKYIAADRHHVLLRWAALLHDLGKPATMCIHEDRGGRITFYNHDRTGAQLVGEVARRLKWSGTDTRMIAGLVALHMRPFFLANVDRSGSVSLKACLRLVRLAGPDLPGLFLLGMADAIAGQGEERPKEVEGEVAALFARLEDVRREHVEPVRSGPPLLTGRDLIDELQLEPGPLFREILEAVEEAQMEKRAVTREDALELARRFVTLDSGEKE